MVGVCTDSHISMRTWMMSFLKGIKFPIISDRDGDFYRAFGVLKLKDGQFGAARALVIQVNGDPGPGGEDGSHEPAQ